MTRDQEKRQLMRREQYGFFATLMTSAGVDRRIRELHARLRDRSRQTPRLLTAFYVNVVNLRWGTQAYGNDNIYPWVEITAKFQTGYAYGSQRLHLRQLLTGLVPGVRVHFDENWPECRSGKELFAQFLDVLAADVEPAVRVVVRLPVRSHGGNGLYAVDDQSGDFYPTPCDPSLFFLSDINDASLVQFWMLYDYLGSLHVDDVRPPPGWVTADLPLPEVFRRGVRRVKQWLLRRPHVA
jgi:hypothetical protein